MCRKYRESTHDDNDDNDINHDDDVNDDDDDNDRGPRVRREGPFQKLPKIWKNF